MFSTTSVIAQTAILVGKTRGCGCCVAWIERPADAGFAPEGENLGDALIRLKMARGIPVEMFSCHTATVEGYTIEGHVPSADIILLLAERPDAIGLAVPGMRLGSPGMDFGDSSESYSVFMINKDGSNAVYASDAAN